MQLFLIFEIHGRSRLRVKPGACGMPLRWPQDKDRQASRLKSSLVLPTWHPTVPFLSDLSQVWAKQKQQHLGENTLEIPMCPWLTGA